MMKEEGDLVCDFFREIFALILKTRFLSLVALETRRDPCADHCLPKFSLHGIFPFSTISLQHKHQHKPEAPELTTVNLHKD